MTHGYMDKLLFVNLADHSMKELKPAPEHLKNIGIPELAKELELG